MENMDEQMSEPKMRLSAAQWVVLSIVLLSLLILWGEVSNGNISNTAYLFAIDGFVYLLSGLNGLIFLYYFKSRCVDWRYRSSISNALWWTLAGIPHAPLVYLNAVTTPLFSAIALFSWLRVLQDTWDFWDNRQQRKNGLLSPIASGNRLLALGIFVLLLSTYPIWLLARDMKTLDDAKTRYHVISYDWLSTGDPLPHYQVKRWKNRTVVTFRGQKVILSDQFIPKGNYRPSDFDRTKLGIVNVNINGRDYTSPNLVRIRTEVDDGNRYWMQVMTAELTDKVEKKTRLAILQSYPTIDPDNIATYDPNNMKCRILFVDATGQVEEEIFRFVERANPSYRDSLVVYVAPGSLGFPTQAFQNWPAIFYPLLYPIVTGIIGLTLTIRGFRKRSQQMTSEASIL